LIYNGNKLNDLKFMQPFHTFHVPKPLQSSYLVHYPRHTDCTRRNPTCNVHR